MLVSCVWSRLALVGFGLVLVGFGWVLLVLVGLGWRWLVLVGFGWFWLVLVGSVILLGWLILDVVVDWC